MGDVIAESIFNYFRDPKNLAVVERLKAAGLQFSIEVAEASSDILAGKTIVISGNFSVSRDDMKSIIEANGGKNASSVSGKTSFLLAGSKPGPEKVKKAQELGIRIVSEEEFFDMVPRADRPAEERQDTEPTLF